jgi:hypothetical protein
MIMYKITIKHTWGDETVVYVGTDNLDEALEVAGEEEVSTDNLITDVQLQPVEPERPWWKPW